MNLINISYLGTAISGLVAVIGIPIALFQIHGINKSLNYSYLMSIFSIEFELNRRKERLSNIRQQIIIKINGRKETQINEDEKEVICLLEGYQREAHEVTPSVSHRKISSGTARSRKVSVAKFSCPSYFRVGSCGSW